MTDNLEDERREYSYANLDRDALDDNPFRQFERWLQEALQRDIMDPTAMTVSTADADGRPWSRIVLLKGVDDTGFRFYTNYESQKGQEIEINPLVTLLFPWLQMDRQVIVSGTTEKLDDEISEAYFDSRPRESQLAAWVSRQSHEVPSRQHLDDEFAQLSERFDGKPIPKPEHWGGYRVVPAEFEFWQGGEHRLHDRFRYRMNAASRHWTITRLAP